MLPSGTGHHNEIYTRVHLWYLWRLDGDLRPLTIHRDPYKHPWDDVV